MAGSDGGSERGGCAMKCVAFKPFQRGSLLGFAGGSVNYDVRPPPRHDDAAVPARPAASETTYREHRPPRHSTNGAEYRVVVAGHRRDLLWREYATPQEAEEPARRLRALGLRVRIERDEAAP